MVPAASLNVELALDQFRRLMASLQVARARLGADPWFDCPMTMSQLRALSLIVAAQHGLSSRELAALLGVGASAITPLVDRLVDHGFVRRLEDQHDRRIARVYATDAGGAALEGMLAGKGDVMREVLATLSEDQLMLVRSAFEVLQAGLQNAAMRGRDN